MWIFGYGSLVWKADFPYIHRLSGYIKGYMRRFWQSSVDHRGIPSSPGRVVTLLPSASDDQVWGVAYEIAKEDEEAVTKHLDYREKDGYKKVTDTFYPYEHMEPNKQAHDSSRCSSLPSEPFDLVIYIGTEDNAYFAGEADVEDIAQQVINSVGPSGTNKEYVYNLAATMRRLAPGVVDDHLFAVEAAVRRLDNENNNHTLT